MVLKQKLITLPDIEPLKRLSQSLAMLDAIMSPEWEYRYYSFNSKWNKGEMMASMRNGSGDEYFILFNSHGAILKGFAHESPMSPFANEPPEVWRGVLDDVPIEFQGFLTEPAFSIEETTFCIWRRYSDVSWQIGNIDYPEDDNPDGSEDLLWILDGNPETYQYFAAEYYEQDIHLSAVQHIYEHKPLTDNIISELNADVSKRELRKDIKEIGYPNTQI
ncbi:MAG: hypothetical protein M3209_03035 [Acidobacteriota bacterium]|nr:hypothetical protein [Acidobacteriota bacterium]